MLVSVDSGSASPACGLPDFHFLFSNFPWRTVILSKAKDLNVKVRRHPVSQGRASALEDFVLLHAICRSNVHMWVPDH
jgi:hypothetical protein